MSACFIVLYLIQIHNLIYFLFPFFAPLILSQPFILAICEYTCTVSGLYTDHIAPRRNVLYDITLRFIKGPYFIVHFPGSHRQIFNCVFQGSNCIHLFFIPKCLSTCYQISEKCDLGQRPPYGERILFWPSILIHLRPICRYLSHRYSFLITTCICHRPKWMKVVITLSQVLFNRPPDKISYQKIIFLFLNQSIWCGYPKEPCH